jgi:hypothetical protein
MLDSLSTLAHGLGGCKALLHGVMRFHTTGVTSAAGHFRSSDHFGVREQTSKGPFAPIRAAVK